MAKTWRPSNYRCPECGTPLNVLTGAPDSICFDDKVKCVKCNRTGKARTGFLCVAWNKQKEIKNGK